MKKIEFVFVLACTILMQNSPAIAQGVAKGSGQQGPNQGTKKPIDELVERLGRRLNSLDTHVRKLEGETVSTLVPNEPSTRQRQSTRIETRAINNGQKPRLNPENFQLLGGYIVPQAFGNPGLAIDFSRRRVYTGSRHNENAINVYALPAIGSDENVASWPRLELIEKIPQFWEKVPSAESTHPYGIEIRGDRLWVSPRGWYTQIPRTFLRIFGKGLNDGEVQAKEIPVRTQAFGGGFVKGHPTKWLVGAGGYMSGQGGVAGPTAATIDGKVLISQINFGTLIFDQREKRPPTLWPKSGKDTWQSMVPRDGVGVWGSDAVVAGGVWTERGLCYWPRLHTGEATYVGGGGKFSGPDETWLYTYDPQAFDNVQFHKWPHGNVIGHELGEGATGWPTRCLGGK